MQCPDCGKLRHSGECVYGRSPVDDAFKEINRVLSAMKRKPLIDQKCIDLAEHFLSDDMPEKISEVEATAGLARTIQDAVEDWYAAKRRRYADDESFGVATRSTTLSQSVEK